MKHTLKINSVVTFTACCALMLSMPQAKADMDTIRDSDSAVWGSVGTSLLDYKESAASPDLPDSERDWIPSLAAGVSYLDQSNWYFAFEGALTYGDAHYNGTYFADPTVPVQGTTLETIATTDGKIGRAFAMGNSALLIPYAELGYRYWNRDTGAGYAENYQNFDALAGLMLQVSPADRLVLSAYGSGGTTFSPQMNTGGITYDLGDSAMYKVGGKIGYNVTERIELFTTLDYDHFRYGQSPVIDGAYEPNSYTDETAARVGLAYHF